MCITEYDEKWTMELTKEEGAENAYLNSIRSIMEKSSMTAEQAMDLINVPVEKRERILDLLQKA